MGQKLQHQPLTLRCVNLNKKIFWMDSFISFFCEHAHQTPWIIFLLLVSTGFFLPISEDLIILMSGVIVGICIPDHYLRLFLWTYAGALLSAWIAYWIGRKFGTHIYDFKYLKNIISLNRMEKIHYYYEKFGIFTFIVGRFCPGGIRNALFLTSGMGKMPFATFVFRDSIASLISVGVIFNLGYYFAVQYRKVSGFIETYDLIALGISSILLISFLIYRFINRAV